MDAIPVEAAPIVSAPAPAAPVSLRRNRDFNLLWGGSVAAMLGLTTADIAYPLVILAMTGSPLKAGLFATVQLIASVLATLPVGHLMDRHDRRRLLLVSESVRTVAAGGVAVAYFAGALSLWQLLATAAVLGGIQPFAAARTLMIRQVVAAEQVPDALTREQLRNHACELAGPPLGGALFAASRALPFLFAALSGVLSLLTVLFLRLPESAARADGGHGGAAEGKPEGGVLLGIKTILRDPVMRATALSLCLVNMAGYPIFLSLIVRLDQQHAASGTTGLVVAATAVGGLLGTPLAKPLLRALRPGWVLIVACMMFALTNFGMTFVANPWADAAFLAASGAAIPSAVVMVNVLILQAVPDEQRGRTAAALEMFLLVGIPAGTLAASAALQWFSPTATLLGLSLVMSLAVLYAVSQRALRAAQWPEARQAG
ncbi:MFS transporter [Catenulispora subtropica]|uniref:Multidrug efflux pump Tap n=1 Tax=Catenulispora subtropica TaxID=450798 RepID=A0ABP5DFZ7_9ACTN